jgi:hypothetical protein
MAFYKNRRRIPEELNEIKEVHEITEVQSTDADNIDF